MCQHKQQVHLGLRVNAVAKDMLPIRVWWHVTHQNTLPIQWAEHHRVNKWVLIKLQCNFRPLGLQNLTHWSFNILVHEMQSWLSYRLCDPPCFRWLSWAGNWSRPPAETASSGGCVAPWTRRNACTHSTHCPGYGCRPGGHKRSVIVNRKK